MGFHPVVRFEPRLKKNKVKREIQGIEEVRLDLKTKT